MKKLMTHLFSEYSETLETTLAKEIFIQNTLAGIEPATFCASVIAARIEPSGLV